MKSLLNIDGLLHEVWRAIPVGWLIIPDRKVMVSEAVTRRGGIEKGVLRKFAKFIESLFYLFWHNTSTGCCGIKNTKSRMGTLGPCQTSLMKHLFWNVLINFDSVLYKPLRSTIFSFKGNYISYDFQNMFKSNWKETSKHPLIKPRILLTTSWYKYKSSHQRC